ncbi:unnamed protein product [Arctogadus glacialis]
MAVVHKTGAAHAATGAADWLLAFDSRNGRTLVVPGPRLKSGDGGWSGSSVPWSPPVLALRSRPVLAKASHGANRPDRESSRERRRCAAVRRCVSGDASPQDQLGSRGSTTRL